MKKNKVILVLLQILLIGEALGELKFSEIESQKDLLKTLKKGGEKSDFFFETTAISLVDLKKIYGSLNTYRLFLLNTEGRGKIITIFQLEGVGEKEEGNFLVWIDEINFRKLFFERKVVYSDKDEENIFFSRILEGKHDRFFTEEFWKDVNVGSVDPGIVIFEKLTNNYIAGSFVPPSSGDKSQDLITFFAELESCIKVLWKEKSN